jgi:hypothetical protein
MATTFNPEISNLVTNEGGTVIYSSGNIIIASEVSEELYRELLKSPYIDSLEVLPLKRYNKTQKIDVPTVTVGNTTVAFDDLETETQDTENIPGAASS